MIADTIHLLAIKELPTTDYISAYANGLMKVAESWKEFLLQVKHRKHLPK